MVLEDERTVTTSPASVRIAHLSDLHIGPLPFPRKPTDLLGKRMTGFLNWHLKRRALHDMSLLAGVVADIAQHAPDHVACTGDLANIGLRRELKRGRRFMEQLGPPSRASFVPGNHDAYVEGSLRNIARYLGVYATDVEGGTEPSYPYVKRAGPVALIGLCSGVPTAPLFATGRLGPEQVEAFGAALAALGREGACRVVMIHHPPHVGGSLPGRGLEDAVAFEATLAREGAELVLHGHEHVTSVAYRPGPGAPVPIVGVASASSTGKFGNDAGGWHLITVTPRAGGGHAIDIRRRGLLATGRVGDLGNVLREDGATATEAAA